MDSLSPDWRSIVYSQQINFGTDFIFPAVVQSLQKEGVGPPPPSVLV